jgi:hypothetical protein
MGHMDLKEAVAVAKHEVGNLFAEHAPHNLRLEEYLYDDHLGVWSLTIGFATSRPVSADAARRYTVVRVSQADKSVLSVRDR